MELRFSARAVRESEQKLKMSIDQMLQTPSVTALSVLIWKGGKYESQEQADEAMDAYLNEVDSNNMFTLFVEVAEKLQEAGFLPREQDLGVLKEKLKGENLKKAMNDLEQSGNEPNLVQSE